MIAVSFAAFLLMFLGVGVAAVRRGTGTRDDYYIASQGVSPALVGLSAVATNNSGYMFIGVIGYTYATGLPAIWLMFGWNPRRLSGVALRASSDSRDDEAPSAQ